MADLPRLRPSCEHGIDYWAGFHESREEMAEAYFHAGAQKFEPRSYREHDVVPIDWGHTLVALYRVRCNLFHGEKARSSENDQLVVEHASARRCAPSSTRPRSCADGAAAPPWREGG